MFTIRVVIETVKPQNCLTCSHDGHSILDTFVIVDGQTPFNKLVECALKNLGMPHLVAESKGLIQINNWKPLLFEQITDNLQQPVTNLLKDISSNLMLKILTKKTPTTIKPQIPFITSGIKSNINSCNSSSVHIKLPDFHSNSATESTSESPNLIQDTVSEHSISDSDTDTKETSTNYSASDTTMKSEATDPNNFQSSFFSEFTNNLLNFPSTSSSSRNSFSSNMDMFDSNESASYRHNYSSNSSGRSRLMFDLITEIPILEQWFEENPHPNGLQIEGYTNTLNEQPYRKSSCTPMTPLNIKIWFKNRRARAKRTNK